MQDLRVFQNLNDLKKTILSGEEGVWWMQPMGGYRLLYFVKGKMAKFWCFIMFIHTGILLCSERWQEGGYSFSSPPKSAIEICVYFVVTIIADFQISCPCNSTLTSAYICWITQ